MSLFSKEMSEQIATTIKDNFATFFPSSKEAKFAQKANTAWEELTNDLNANFGSSLTVKQVREKWHNMKKESKRRFADEKRERSKTGGGRADLRDDPVHSAIVDTFAEKASFSGIPGARATPIFPESSTSTSLDFDLEIQSLTGFEQKMPFKLLKTDLGATPNPSPVQSTLRTRVPSGTSAVIDLQREVLELQKDFFKNHAVPLAEKMTAYYDYKVAKFLSSDEKEESVEKEF
ncbi:hypothetical protein niasHT_014804 [Heterodera trifolii]|uniref:Regulatory protein zeste n=1 Tax=Heterodera trifolii TaxID=157864 RepID=A0ABD2L6M4_9BILA